MTEKTKNDQSKSTLLVVLVIVVVTGAIGLAVFASRIGELQGTGPVANATLTDFTGITPIEPAQEVADFTLTDQNGEPMSLSDMHGKPTLIFFGFTHCPDLCPTTLSEYRQIYEAIGEDMVNLVFISIDGARDTPEVIKAYLEAKNVPYVIGLTGDLETVLQAGAPFGLVAEQGPKDEAGNYDMIHTSSVFFLNREGQLVAKYAYGTLLNTMIDDIRSRL
jgi:protein SCO1